MRIVVFITLIIAFSLGICLADDQTELKTEVSKDKVKIGEPFKYVISMNLKSKETPKVEQPVFKKFSVISQGTTQNYSFKDNQVILNIKLQYVLIALEEGELELPSAVLTYKDKKLQSPSKIIKVQGITEEFKRKKKQKKSLPGILEDGVSI